MMIAFNYLVGYTLKGSEKITNIILKALKKTGQRGIIDRGWGDLGTNLNITEDVYLLVDCPHDWLFPQCCAVVHDGGPGTIAAGLKAGCPSNIMPVCGDQFFWGEIVHHKGIGPAPIPLSKLNVESLTQAIRFMLQPQVKSRAKEFAVRIMDEDGVGGAVEAFHRHLPPELPLPPLSKKKDVGSNSEQWFSGRVGKFYCLPWAF
ncbi:hypothetical protein ACS0TY_036648 [Phlomoides rotata]